MRSIRLSLIVYFAALVTAALSAVSVLVYQTTAQTLEQMVDDLFRTLSNSQPPNPDLQPPPPGTRR